MQPRLRRRSTRRHRAKHRCNGAETHHGDDPERHNGEQKVGNRAGSNHRDALLDGFAIEGLIQLMLGDRRLALVQHFDVTAQRDGRNGVFGTLAVVPTHQRRAKTDGEAQHLDAAATGHPEMAVFMNGHQQPQGNHRGQQRRQQIHSVPHKVIDRLRARTQRSA